MLALAQCLFVAQLVFALEGDLFIHNHFLVCHIHLVRCIRFFFLSLFLDVDIFFVFVCMLCMFICTEYCKPFLVSEHINNRCT